MGVGRMSAPIDFENSPNLAARAEYGLEALYLVDC